MFMYRNWSLRDRTVSRRVRLVKHIVTVTADMMPDREDSGIVLAFFAVFASIGAAFSVSEWAYLSTNGALIGVLSVAGISLLLIPLAVTLFWALITVCVATCEFTAEATAESRSNCRALRDSTKKLRAALRDQYLGLEDFRVQQEVYRRHDPSNVEFHGPWSRMRMRRVQRLRSRLRACLLARYESALAQIVSDYRQANCLAASVALDETPMVRSFRSPPVSIRSLRVLEGYAPLTGCVTEQRQLQTGTNLVFAPKWVLDVVELSERAAETDRMVRYWRGPYAFGSLARQVSQCVPLDGADPETVTKLFEPNGDGPYADLAEVIAAAKLV